MQLHFPINPTTGKEDQSQLPWADGVPATGQEGSFPPSAMCVEAMYEIVNAIVQGGLTPSSLDPYQLMRVIRGGQLDFDATETGTADAMVVQVGIPHTQIRAGLPFSFVKGPNANTGAFAPSLTITDLQGNNGLTGAIFKATGGALAKGDLPGNVLVTVRAVAPGVFALISLLTISDVLALIGSNPSVVTTIMATNYAKGSLIARRVFTANGTYNPSAGVRFIRVTCVGGGAAGGSAGPTGSGQFGAGGGGGAGGITVSEFYSGFSGIPLTIGLPGVSSVSSGYVASQTGGNTTFGSLAGAQGGIGGGNGSYTSSPATQAGGPGGGPGVGNVFSGSGQAGGNAVSFSGSNEASGAGGSSPLGFAGGSSAFTGNYNGNTATSASYGAGGGGAVCQGSNSNGQVGGSGVQGCIIVEEYA